MYTCSQSFVAKKNPQQYRVSVTGFLFQAHEHKFILNQACTIKYFVIHIDRKDIQCDYIRLHCQHLITVSPVLSNVCFSLQCKVSIICKVSVFSWCFSDVDDKFGHNCEQKANRSVPQMFDFVVSGSQLSLIKYQFTTLVCTTYHNITCTTQ